MILRTVHNHLKDTKSNIIQLSPIFVSLHKSPVTAGPSSSFLVTQIYTWNARFKKSWVYTLYFIFIQLRCQNTWIHTEYSSNETCISNSLKKFGLRATEKHYLNLTTNLHPILIGTGRPTQSMLSPPFLTLIRGTHKRESKKEVSDTIRDDFKIWTYATRKRKASAMSPSRVQDHRLVVEFRLSFRWGRRFILLPMMTPRRLEKQR